MEQNNTAVQNNEPLLKERGYVKSIAAGLRLPLRHPWGILRHIWPTCLVCGLVWFFVSKWVCADLWAFRTVFSGPVSSPADVVGMTWLRVVLWGMLSMLFLGVLAGQTAYLMRRYGELNYFPAVQPWHVWRDIAPSVVSGLVLCLVGYLVAVALASVPFLFMPRRLWAVLLGAVLVCLWALFYVPAGQRFMMEKKPLPASLWWSFSHPTELSGSSAVVVVCSTLLFSVMAAGAVPVVALAYVDGVASDALRMGDAVDLPGSFFMLRNLGFFLTSSIVSLSWIFVFVPLCFEWGSRQESKKLIKNLDF
ncbi:MAG: hypothetical protein KBT12_02555 [Bacteroidales bacterium]|nr:hypothetical protein [Candidatus Physcousia equi]